jgi:tRNA A-37 threonylcarbamoyl transferase component Bud32/tetratricopeptide (TPR) repeat protein
MQVRAGLLATNSDCRYFADMPESPANDDLTPGAIDALYDAAMAIDNEEQLPESLTHSRERYRFLTDLGAGGFKRVQLVHDEVTGREVAMAIPRDPESDKSVSRFVREAQILAMLQHSAIIPLYDLGVDDEVPYFVMKVAGGKNLDRVIKSYRTGTLAHAESWPLQVRLDIFRAICGAIAYAHGQGVMHLDLKPANVQLNKFGEVLVCDWGSARLIADAIPKNAFDSAITTSELRHVTLDGVVAGTPGYMAPEQAAGTVSLVGPRTDVYALGAMLYSLLTYVPPIQGYDAEVIRKRTIKGKVTPPMELRPNFNIPPGLNAITTRAMALDPLDRYATVKDLLSDLDTFLSGFAPDAQAAGFGTQLRLLCKRHKTIIIAGTIILAVGAIAAGSLFRQSGMKRQLAVQQANAEKAEAALAVQTANSERAMAELATQKAERQREQAEVEARKATLRLVDAGDEMTAEAVDAFKKGEDYLVAETKLRTALDLDPKNQRAWHLYGNFYAARLELDKTLIAYDKAGEDRVKELRPVIERCAKLPRDGQQQEITVFCELAAQLRAAKNVFLVDMLVSLYPRQHHKTYGVPESKSRLAVLKRLNPKQANWQVDWHGTTVSLKGHGNLHDLTALRGATISTLDLRGTGIQNFGPLNFVNGLERVIVDPDKTGKVRFLGKRVKTEP